MSGDTLTRAAADLRFLADHAERDGRSVELDVPSVRALANVFDADLDGIAESTIAAAYVLIGEAS